MWDGKVGGAGNGGEEGRSLFIGWIGVGGGIVSGLVGSLDG